MRGMQSPLPRIGVLGGMGPLATADFFSKLIAATPATRDQDHFPVSIDSTPQIPDRVAAIEGYGEDPFPALLAAAHRLLNAGCALVAMPCNTAHLWHGRIAAALLVPVLHIADAVAAQLGSARRIALMGTTATLRTRLYQERIGGAREWAQPTEQEMAAAVMPGVAEVKRYRVDEARAMLVPVARRLAGSGVDALVLGCTEIPIAVRRDDCAVPVIDATRALAEATVAAARRLAGAATS